MATLALTKHHGLGNDFLVLLDPAGSQPIDDALARRLCDRHTGIGADGLIAYEPTPDGASMRLFNADGGSAEVSGNGVRALAALLVQDQPDARGELVVRTDAGAKRLSIGAREGSRQTFRAAMGLPRGLGQESIVAAGERLSIAVMDFGNPQAVLLGPRPDADRFRRLGRALERHERFPQGTNIEFAEVESPGTVRILIWERGVGPTTSSGTGSCAALVAAAAFGGAARDAQVVAPGGAQRVEWLEDSVYLTGWAEVLVHGDWLRQIPRTG
jgi:diaminopimelate epimerase